MDFFNTKQFWVPAIVLAVLIVVVILLGKFVVLPNQANSVPAPHTSCQTGDYYDLQTGKACPNAPVHTACQPGDLFNIETGARC